MATPRKRTSGFVSGGEEELAVEALTTEETLEELVEVTTPQEDKSSVASEPRPFVEESIVPTPDLGPRFLEDTAPVPEPVEPKKLPELMPPPKRHPRNVPRFSRTR